METFDVGFACGAHIWFLGRTAKQAEANAAAWARECIAAAANREHERQQLAITSVQTLDEALGEIRELEARPRKAANRHGQEAKK